jgi:hypothetical protein
MKEPEIKGQLFGATLIHEGNHISVQLSTEDDEVWHDHGTRFDASWLGDLIFVLAQARKKIKD